MQTQTIPRIRKDVLTFMPLTCTWSQELMENVKKTCLSKNALKGWIPIKIHIVDNPDLEEIFEDRKAALRKMGRTEEELTEELCFMAESWKSVVSICKYGVRCVEKKTNILGDTRAGIHLNRNYDMLLRFMTFRNFITARCVVVFKVVPGRVKRVMPRFKGRTLLHPSKHYDAHVSMIDPDPTISVCEGLANNFIYIYQLDDETKIPYQHPRQAVPYAVIQLRQPYRMTVSRPFTSFRDRFLAQMRYKESRGSHKSYISRRKDDSTRSSSKHERHRRRSSLSDVLDSDESPSRRKKRSRTPKEIRKRLKTPPRKSSDTELRISNKTFETKVESDESNMQTKLQKIEEEIKLRQSKLTELRHIKISQDSEKINQRKDMEEDHKNTNIAVLQSNTVESSEQGLVQTSNTLDLSDNFSPKITSVYSTSCIKFEMSDTFSSQYRELSSGASTPTLDEPGGQSSGNDNKLAEPLNIKDNPKETIQLFVKKEVGEKPCLKLETERCLKEEANDAHIQALHITEKTIKTEVVQTTDLETTKENKAETSRKDQHIAQQATHTEKELDIKRLFREAIHQMDPSDLYELLTQKLADEDDDGVTEETITEDDPKRTEPTIDTKCEQSNDDMILDLSCKSKPVTKLEAKNVEKNVENNVTDINEKVSGNDENKQNNGTKVGELSPQSEKTSSQSDIANNHSSSLKTDCSAMVLDNLEILASVASELQRAKSNSIGLCNVTTNKIAVKTNKEKSKVLSGKIGGVNKYTKIKSSDNEKEGQEYIFDAETFSPEVNRVDSRLNDTEHGFRGKGASVVTAVKSSPPINTSNKTSSQSLNTKTVNNFKRPTTKSPAKTDCKTVVVKTRPKDQELTSIDKCLTRTTSNKESSKQEISVDSSVKHVLASTKRKTANSVAAAIDATEQLDFLSQKSTSRSSKQDHKRTTKQNTVPTNNDKSIQNNPSPDQSTTMRQRVLRSGKILSVTIETRPASRGNLFERFSSDTAFKPDEKKDNNTLKTQMAATRELQIVKEQKTTNQNGSNIENATTIKQEHDCMEHIYDSSSASLIVSPVKDKTYEIQTAKKQPTNIQNVLISNNKTTIKQSTVFTDNIDDSSSSLQTISDDTIKAGEILTATEQPKTNQNVITKDITTNVKQSVYTEKSNDSSVISPVPNKDLAVKNAKEQPMTYQTVITRDIATTIKQEPVCTDSSSPLSIVSPITNKIFKKSDSIEKTPKTPHVLDESIVDLMDTQVTEKIKQSEITLNRIPAIVKKEPVSPRDDSFLSENNEKQDGKSEVCKLSAASIQSNNVSITSQSGVKDHAAESGTSALTVSLKVEPVSPNKESSHCFKMSTEKTSNTTKSVKTVTFNQVESSVKKNPCEKSQESSQISTEIDKTLKDLEQVIGIFSLKVRQNSGEVDLNSSCAVEQKSKLTQNTSNGNKSEIITCTTATTNNKDNLSISEKNETLSEKDDTPAISTKTSIISYKPEQTSSNIMSIEVITGINPVKKSPVRNKVSQGITLTTSSKSKSVKQNTRPANKEKINAQASKKGSINVNKSGTKTKSNGDDTVRTTRVLQSAVHECNSSGKTVSDMSKRIKKEPVTEDEYYGTSRSSPVNPFNIQAKQSSKKQIDNTKSKQSEKRRFPESTQKKSESKSVEKKEGNKSQSMQPSYWKKRPLNKMENSSSTFINPLEAIRTEYSSLKYRAERKNRSRGNDNDGSFARKGNTSKNGDRQISSSSVSSQSSSIESPTRDFAKRDRYLPSKSDSSYLRYSSTGPLKYQSSGSGSLYVKSKWDSNENSRGSCSDRNLFNTFTSEPKQQGAYTTSYNPKYSMPYQYIQPNQNIQNTSAKNYPNLSTRDNRSSIFTTKNLSTSKQNELGRGNSFNTFETERQNQTRTYSNNNFSRLHDKRERSNSLERPYNSSYKRTRSNSNERNEMFDRKRHRSDSRDRKRPRLSDRSRERSDSRDRDRNNRSRLKRKYSGSRGRDRSSSSEYNRQSPSSSTNTGLYNQNTDERFDLYRPLTSTKHSFLPSDNGNRGQMLNSLNSREPNDADITNTLSKAMSTLLKKIIYDDKAQDNTKEGRMADMVLDMVKARVSGEPNQNQQQLPQSFGSKHDTQIHSTGMKNPYDNCSEQRPSSISTLISTQTTRYQSANRTRSRYGNVRSSQTSSTNRSTYTSTHKTPPIFNSILIPKYNPNFQNSSFTGTRRRGLSYNRPWSIGRFNSRKISSSRSTNFTTGSSKEKYPKSGSRSARDTKSPSK